MYLPLLIIAAGGDYGLVGLLPIITGAIAVFWTPLAGDLIDSSRNREQVRHRVILASVAVACGSIIGMALLDTLPALILLFGMMSIGVHTGWTAINSFLASETSHDELGSVSGFGTIFGYLGGGFGAGGAVLIEHFVGMGPAVIFIAIFLFTFGIIPGLFLPESENPSVRSQSLLQGLRDLAPVIRKNRTLKACLIASILWTDALSTVMTFASLLAVNVLGIPEQNTSLYLAPVLPAAILGGYIHGNAGDRYGLVNIMFLNLILWASGYVFIIYFVELVPSIVISLIAGFALGGTVSLTRAIYAKILPPGFEGRLFGLAAMFFFFGGSIGPLLTGIIADLPGMNLRYALIVPYTFTMFSMPFLLLVRENGVVFEGP